MIAGAPDLSGRWALVTGAAKRLGRDLALALADAGADVLVHYRSSEAEALAVAEEIAAKGRRAEILRADLAEPDGPSRLAAGVLEASGGVIGVVINNVGNYAVGPIEDSPASQWRETFAANLIAPHELTRRLHEAFPATGGHVVNLGYAGVENLRPHPEAAAYQASKTALLVLTKSWAVRLAPRGVRVNMISPGQLEYSVDLPADPKSAIPLGRPGRSSDVIGALFFLLQPNSYVTGVNIDVAGGWRL